MESLIKFCAAAKSLISGVKTLPSSVPSFRQLFFETCETPRLGWILIDRAGTHFELILNFLRDGNLEVSQLTDKELFAVLTEANFYSLDPLSQLIQQEQCYIV